MMAHKIYCAKRTPFTADTDRSVSLGALMRKFLIVVLALIATAMSLAPANAQTATGDGWVLLGAFDVTPGAASDKLDLATTQGRSKAVRLVAALGSMTLARVVVRYANGQLHYEDRPPDQLIRLALKDKTLPIDPRDEERFVDAVEVVYMPGSKTAPRSRIEVWALQSPAGTAAQRRKVAESKAAEESGDTIARKTVSLAVDRDVV